ncbi:MAG: CocE/NonD family hydrolase, partial [Bacteroidia bacterium]
MKRNMMVEYIRIMNERNDVLIFETEPFMDSLTISGPISAVLYASSSAVDTDFSVTLNGIDIEGGIFPIGQTFGILRARFRNFPGRVEFLERDKIYKYMIDLSHTCYTMAPGEKIRLEVASCSFPEFSRNLNTGFDNETSSEIEIARQTIYHNTDYKSHIV